MATLDWRIYYDDGSTFDSSMGEPEDAPGFGVQCVVEADDDAGRVVLAGFDWYYYHCGSCRWWGSDIHGLLDKLLHRIDVEALMQGRNCVDFNAILHKATNDPDFPRKSAKVPRERPT